MSETRAGVCPSCDGLGGAARSEFGEVKEPVEDVWENDKWAGKVGRPVYGLWHCLKCGMVVYRPGWAEGHSD